MCIRKKTNCLHKIKETNFFKFSIGISSYFSNLIQDLLTDFLFCAIITKAYLICFKNEKMMKCVNLFCPDIRLSDDIYIIK